MRRLPLEEGPSCYLSRPNGDRDPFWRIVAALASSLAFSESGGSKSTFPGAVMNGGALIEEQPTEAGLTGGYKASCRTHSLWWATGLGSRNLRAKWLGRREGKAREQSARASGEETN